MYFPSGRLGLGVGSVGSAFHRLLGVGIVLAGSAGVAACGSGNDGHGNKDTTPPVIAALAATLGNPSPVTLSLSAADDERVITNDTPLALQLQASDDVTSTNKLDVQALDADGKAIAGQTASLHNGLWQVDTTAKPGLTIRVAVADEAGNQTIWPYAAIFPTQAEALARQWTLLVYATDGTVASRPHMTLTATTWCQDDDAQGDGPVGGTWSLQSDGRLKMEARGHAACASGAGNDGNTVLWSRTSDFYVDSLVFSDGPYQSQNGAGANGDIVGSWTRTADIATTGSAQPVTSSLSLQTDNTFQQTTEDGHQITGTYQKAQNTDYGTNFGDLLLLTATQVDGAAVTPSTTVHYWRIQGEQLLLDPFIEIH